MTWQGIVQDAATHELLRRGDIGVFRLKGADFAGLVSEIVGHQVDLSSAEFMAARCEVACPQIKRTAVVCEWRADENG